MSGSAFKLEIFEDKSLKTIKEVISPKRVKNSSDQKTFDVIFDISHLQDEPNHYKNFIKLAIIDDQIKSK